MKTLLTALARLLVSDHTRNPDRRPPTVPAPTAARHANRRARTAAGFASVIVFETICA